MNLWKKLNHGHDFLKISPTAISTHAKGSVIEIFIVDEYNGALNLVQFLHKCFMNLNKICKGTIIPNEHDLTMGNSLINFEVSKIIHTLFLNLLKNYAFLDAASVVENVEGS